MELRKLVVNMMIMKSVNSDPYICHKSHQSNKTKSKLLHSIKQSQYGEIGAGSKPRDGLNPNLHLNSLYWTAGRKFPHNKRLIDVNLMRVMPIIATLGWCVPQPAQL